MGAVFLAVCGDLKECFFERALLRSEFVQNDTMSCSKLANSRGAHTRDVDCGVIHNGDCSTELDERLS